MNNDPWKNRNVGMKCDTCIWFVEKKNLSTQPDCDAGVVVIVPR